LKTKELVFSEIPVISWARKKSHLARNHGSYLSQPVAGESVLYSSLTDSAPRCALRMTSRGFMEGGSPADACRAIWLSFRALGRLSAKIRSKNLEMNRKS
jgi:hypothetical protein